MTLEEPLDEELSKRLGLIADLGVREPDVASVVRRARRKNSLPAAAAVASALAVVLVLAFRGFVATDNGPLSSARAAATERPSESFTPSANVIGDEMPTAVAGRPVLRGEAIAAYIAGAVDDSRFLIGGWLVAVYADCAVPSNFATHPLLSPCHDGFFLVDQPPSATVASDGGLRLVVNGEAGLLSSPSPLVLEVHVHDPRSASCPKADIPICERTAVVDGVVWAAGRLVP